MSKYENELKRDFLEPRGYTVVRAAGSMGACDLVVLDGLQATLVEVKKAREGVKYISNTGKEKQQYRDLLELAEDHLVLYAIRHTTGTRNIKDRWRFHWLEGDEGIEDYPICRREDGQLMDDVFPEK